MKTAVKFVIASVSLSGAAAAAYSVFRSKENRAADLGRIKSAWTTGFGAVKSYTQKLFGPSAVESQA